MEVYTPALELIGFLEIQRSVIWSEKAFSAGKFSVESLITAESMTMLQPENIIWIEGETAGIIETVLEESGPNGPYITAGGPTLTGILDRRVLWGTYNLKGTAPEIMHQLVNDCCINPTRGNVDRRKISGLVLLDAPADGDTIQLQATGGTLLERLEALGKTYGVAFGVRFNPAVPQMEFWTLRGQDRSIRQSKNNPVLYSTELDDVLSSEYTYNSQDYSNVALVAGEGEGADRVYVTVENKAEEPDTPVLPTQSAYMTSPPTGLARRELFIDARDLQSDADPESPLTAEEYAALLVNRGRQKLAANQLVRSFAAEVRTFDPTYPYGEDFQLGDTITVTDERLGITVDAVVQGVERSISADGESLTLMLGYGQPTIFDKLKQKEDK